MKTALRLFLLIAVVLAALATVALVGALQWLSTQDSIRLIVDGDRVDLGLIEQLGWVPLTAGIALVMLIVFLTVPLVLLLALGFSMIAGLLSLAAALSPVLLLGALAWWIYKRQPSASPPPAAPLPAAPHKE